MTKGAVFGWGHAAAMKLLDGNQMFSDSTNTIIAGGMGGFVQGVALSPVLLLKTRVMTNDKVRTNGIRLDPVWPCLLSFDPHRS